MSTAYRVLTVVLLLGVLAAAIATLWLPDLWWRFALTALLLLFGAASSANAAEVARREERRAR